MEVIVLSTQVGDHEHRVCSGSHVGTLEGAGEIAWRALRGYGLLFETACPTTLKLWSMNGEPQENRLYLNTQAEICNGKKYQNWKRHEKGKEIK